MRAGTIKGFYATDTAEKMLCRSRAKLIFNKTIFSVKQVEVVVMHNQMQKLSAPANRTIAIQNFDAARGRELETYLAAMTTAGMHNAIFSQLLSATMVEAAE